MELLVITIIAVSK